MQNQTQGSKSYLFSIVLVAVLGGLLFGYDTAVISGAERGLQAFFEGAKDFTYTNVHDGIGIVGALSETSTDWQTLSEFEMSAQDIMEILFPKTPGGH